MPAYIVAWLSTDDAESMAAYAAAAPAIVEQYGGRYLAKGPGAEALEGEWDAMRMAILEFPSRDDAVRWWDSPEYRPWRDLRQRVCDTAMIVTGDQD